VTSTRLRRRKVPEARKENARLCTWALISNQSSISARSWRVAGQYAHLARGDGVPLGEGAVARLEDAAT
jgi:hypothetical protein